MDLRLRFRLQSGEHSIPLALVHSVVGYAKLSGETGEYFLGWLRFHGEWAPVFDLNCVACEQSTPEMYGSRIILVPAGERAPVRLIGLLAGGVTDTVAANNADVVPFDLNLYLPMLMNLIPAAPAEAR